MEETETVLAQAKGEAGLRNGASISFGEGLVAFCREDGLGYGNRPQECQTDDENVESSDRVPKVGVTAVSVAG